MYLLLSAVPAAANGLEKRINQLLIQAMSARDKGNTKLAELNFLQAKKLNHNLKRPRWLPSADSEQTTESEANVYLDLLKSVDYTQAAPFLEESLGLDPANRTIREAYLDLARKNADKAQILRHESYFGISSPDYRFPIALVLLLLIAGKIALLIRRKNKGSQ